MPYESHMRLMAPPLPPGPRPAHYWPAWFAANGRRMDQVTNRVRDASLAHLPLPGAPGDALDAIGEDRGLRRAIGETDPDYSAYLREAWLAWGGDDRALIGQGGGGGSPFGMLLQLQRAGFPTGEDGATIVTQIGRFYQLVGDALAVGDLGVCINRQNLIGDIDPRPGWMFDGRDNFYSVFGLLFPSDVEIDGARLNEVVERWKCSKDVYNGCWILRSGRLWGWPVGRTWGDGWTWGDSTADFIPPATGDDVRMGYTFSGG